MAAGVMVRRVLLEIGADDAQAVEKIDAIKVKAEELRTLHPELTPRINTAEAQAKMAVLRDELKSVGKGTEIQIGTGEATAKLAALRQEEAATRRESGLGAKTWEATKFALVGVGIGAALAVKGAADFEAQTTRLVTSAGELPKNLGMVRQGMLAISAQTATSTSEMASGMYLVESAGFHGAAGLTVLKAAAQGAKDENAQLAVVANAVTDVLVDYHMKASASADVTSKLVKAVSFGKTNFEEFSSSIANVAPLASIMHLSLADVTGVLAEMTAHGMSAARASEDEANAMRELIKPNGAMIKEWTKLGITAQDVQSHLGKSGLAGTLQWLTGVAHAGAGAIGQNFTQALGKAVGTAPALQVALSVTGENFKSTTQAINGISGATADAQGNVDGFSTVTQTMSFKLAAAKESIKAAGISLGQVLLPAASAVLTPLTHMLQLIAGNRGASIAFASVVGGTLAFVLGGKLVKALSDAKEGFATLRDSKTISWAGSMAQKMGLLKTAQAEAAVATEGEAVAQEGANAAFALSPIGLIVIGLAAVTIAFVELWKHSAGFRDFWKAAWHDIASVFDTVRHAIATGFDFITHAASEAFGWVRGHWPLILGILTGPVGIAVAFVVTHWHQIVHGAEQMFHDVISFFTRLPGNILSALGDLGHLLWTAGQQVIQGFIGSLTSGLGQIGSIASQIGSTLLGGVKSVLGIGSPSKEFAWLGAMVTMGLGGGIRDTAHQAISESRRLGAMVMEAANDGLITGTQATRLEARIAAALRTQLNRAAAAAARDRKIMENLGLILHQGLMQGLTGTSGQVSSAISKLLAMVKTEMGAGLISYSKATSITDWLEGDSRRLQSLATRRANILATIKAAEAYAANVTSSTETTFGLVSAAGSVTPALGVGGIVGQLLGDVSQIRAFQRNIAKLRKMGLNKAYIDQLIQAGPVQGGQIAAELAAGNEGDIRAVNRAESQIAAASVSLGQTAANAMYDSGKMAGKGFLSGLQGQLAALNALMRQLARSMVAELRKELGIRSPSEVMREHGRLTVQGFALGIEDSAHLVTAATARMARSVTTGTTGTHAAGAGAGGTGKLQLEWVGGSADQALITLLKNHIRIRGGNPAVLGA